MAALHVSSDIFAHHKEHLTVFTTSRITHVLPAGIMTELELTSSAMLQYGWAHAVTCFFMYCSVPSTGYADMMCVHCLIKLFTDSAFAVLLLLLWLLSSLLLKDKIISVYNLKAYRGNSGITPLIFKLGTRVRWMVNILLPI